MSVALITGSAGLVGSEAALFFGSLGMDVAGIDNDMRRVIFGEEASTDWNKRRIARQLGWGYRHHEVDIRDRAAVLAVFAHYGAEIELVLHTAAQPSHDWAAREPFTDFDINAVGTLNLLGGDTAVRAGCDVRLYLYEQGLWRPSESASA